MTPFEKLSPDQQMPYLQLAAAYHGKAKPRQSIAAWLKRVKRIAAELYVAAETPAAKVDSAAHQLGRQEVLRSSLQNHPGI